MNPTNNQHVLNWLNEMAAMTKPDNIVWIDGSEEQVAALRKEALASGEIIQLNQEKLPGCYLHRTTWDDVARVEGRTFICTKTKEDAGNINNWMDPAECRAKLTKLYTGCMKGRTMYVIPYSMSIVGSPFAKYGIELTDSIYVVLNMEIMTRVGFNVLEALGDSSDFIKGLHSKATLDAENRYIVHFPEDDTIWSINSNYGGNVLLGKKCFALRIASYLGRKEGWMAEHMLILGVTYPDGTKKYVTAAFPSACGKTNLAMLIPPEVFQKQGYKIETVGDDIAWLRVGSDGRLWAVNPENGFFGVAPGTNEKSNPNALHTCMKDTIFTNVCLNTDTNTVWWEGLDNNPPVHAINWKGQPWDYHTYDKADKVNTSGAHPNSRFTAKATNCPCLSPAFYEPNGVPVDAIIFGGRRARTAPLVYQSTSWQNGTFVGSIMASETTAAAAGAVGVVRRDPMAMRPFVGYNMGAGKKMRVRKLFTMLLAAEALVGAVALILAEGFPRQLIAIFGAANESSYYADFAVKAFRTYLCMMVLACINKACFIFLQAIGKALASTLLSMFREVVFGVGFALLLPVFFGLDGVLYSMPVSDLLTFIISAIIIMKTYRELNVEGVQNA